MSSGSKAEMGMAIMSSVRRCRSADASNQHCVVWMPKGFGLTEQVLVPDSKHSLIPAGSYSCEARFSAQRGPGQAA